MNDIEEKELPKEDQKEETTPEFDATVQKMLNTPPKPHGSIKQPETNIDDDGVDLQKQ